MKQRSVLLALLILAGCVTHQPWPNTGDTYYRSRSAFTYVDGFYGFPYFGPYAWYWYHPVWYSPMMGNHYSWHRPYYALGPTYLDPAARRGDKKAGPQDPVRHPLRPGPILPIDLEQVVIGPDASRAAFKPQAYGSSGMKQRSMAKSSKTSVAAPRSSRSSSPAPRPATRSHSSKPPPIRPVSRDEY